MPSLLEWQKISRTLNVAALLFADQRLARAGKASLEEL
jgi:hypothetical protein